MSYLCPHCNSFPMEDYVWWVSGRKSIQIGGARSVEKNMIGSNQAEAKLLIRPSRAHAVPQRKSDLCCKCSQFSTVDRMYTTTLPLYNNIVPFSFFFFLQPIHRQTVQLYNTQPDSCTHMDRTGLESIVFIYEARTVHTVILKSYMVAELVCCDPSIHEDAVESRLWQNFWIPSCSRT